MAFSNLIALSIISPRRDPARHSKTDIQNSAQAAKR